MTRSIAGVDVGGTFTDATVYDLKTSEIITAKSSSTPPRYVQGVLKALKETSVQIAEIRLIAHTTTITSNAIIERTGPETALITTKGHRDAIEIGRADRGDMFDPTWIPPPTLVKRRNRLTVNERINYKGEVVQSLNDDEIRAIARILKKRKINTVAVCFINSFRNSIHEHRTREIIKTEIPRAEVCISYDVDPQILEYERASTTVINTYLRPVVAEYLRELTNALKEIGFKGALLLGVISGGVMSPKRAGELPIGMSEAGPAGGVISTAFWTSLAGYKEALSFDMGGTTAKFAIIRDGRPKTVSQIFLDHNKPIRYPSIDVRSIGAGGGSIAWIDASGLLDVGPRSAGALPGPACYGLGGKNATVTDAHLVLRRLNPGKFAGGTMKIHPDLALRAVKENVAAYLGKEPEESAQGILDVSEQKMINEARTMIIREGIDPRDFVLVAFGGAGPLHGAMFAKELNVGHIMVPPNPGIFNATGCLLLDYRHDFAMPIVRRIREIKNKELEEGYSRLEGEAVKTLRDEGVPESSIKLERQADLRYFRKAGHISVSVSIGDTLDVIVRKFYEMTKKTYGYVMPESMEIEIINFRVAGYGYMEKPIINRIKEKGTANKAFLGDREVYFKDEGFTLTKIYDRAKLLPGAIIDGPAIVEQYDTTVAIPPWAHAHVDEYLNIVMQKAG